MDVNYLYSLLAFAVGVLAGFQGVYERYQKDSIAGALTFPGIFYLFTRGALPALVFISLYASNLIEDNLWAMSLACGTGAEVVLRLKLYIGEKQTGNGGFEEILRGPFDLLRWYQDRFLEWIADWLAGSRKDFVKNQLPQGVLFADLCQTVLDNCLAYPSPQIVSKVKEEINRLKIEYAAAIQKSTSTNVVEKSSCSELGYVILNAAGKTGFKTFLN